MYEPILGRFKRIRVRVEEEERAAGEREEERETIQEMSQTGLSNPLYMLLDRVGPYPVHSLLLRTVRSRSRWNLDQSNAPGVLD